MGQRAYGPPQPPWVLGVLSLAVLDRLGQQAVGYAQLSNRALTTLNDVEQALADVGVALNELELFVDDISERTRGIRFAVSTHGCRH